MSYKPTLCKIKAEVLEIWFLSKANDIFVENTSSTY